MKTVKYTGNADFQEFGHADFAKAGVEQTKLVFERGVNKEVSDEVADALTSTDSSESPIFYEFSFELVKTDEEPDPGKDEEAVDETKAVKKKAAKKAAEAQNDAVTETGGAPQDPAGEVNTGSTGTAAGAS